MNCGGSGNHPEGTCRRGFHAVALQRKCWLFIRIAGTERGKERNTVGKGRLDIAGGRKPVCCDWKV